MFVWGWDGMTIAATPGQCPDLGAGAKRPPHGVERRLGNPPGEGFRRERAGAPE